MLPRTWPHHTLSARTNGVAFLRRILVGQSRGILFIVFLLQIADADYQGGLGVVQSPGAKNSDGDGGN